VTPRTVRYSRPHGAVIFGETAPNIGFCSLRARWRVEPALPAEMAEGLYYLRVIRSEKLRPGDSAGPFPL